MLLKHLYSFRGRGRPLRQQLSLPLPFFYTVSHSLPLPASLTPTPPSLLLLPLSLSLSLSPSLLHCGTLKIILINVSFCQNWSLAKVLARPISFLLSPPSLSLSFTISLSLSQYVCCLSHSLFSLSLPLCLLSGVAYPHNLSNMPQAASLATSIYLALARLPHSPSLSLSLSPSFSRSAICPSLSLCFHCCNAGVFLCIELLKHSLSPFA